jgi:hypothetical protein
MSKWKWTLSSKEFRWNSFRKSRIDSLK